VTAVRREVGITWDWAEAGRGALCAVPAAVILVTVDVSLGMVFAIATLPVAMLGVPPQRRQRPRLGLVGLGFAASYALGSVLGLWEVAAVAALTVLAFAGVLFSVRKPAARLLPALLLPGFALGMNHPAPDGLAVAAVLLAGCAWATLITYGWPQPHTPAITATPPTGAPDPAGAGRAARSYAILFAAAAGIGLALGYLLDLVHVAWAAAAAMFIMRPNPDLLASRAVGRTVATFAGVLAAGLLLRRGPTEIALAVITVAAIAAMVAVRTSRWYVTGAGSGLIVLLMSGVAGTQVFEVSFAERLLETALGAGLALSFGVAIPAGLRWLGRRRAAANPAAQTPS
jgi:hypothetical protein